MSSTTRSNTGNLDDLSAEVLLRETAWLRGLSRQLVGDPDRAEDLAQETWLALARHPKAITHRRSWLSRVARNFAARFIRRESQRGSREAIAARPEAQPSAEESVERVRIQNRVVAALLQLAEPHRTTVVLRFFEDLPPREIATRMNVPVETVRSRLRVALGRLRTRLDGEFAHRRAWATPLVTGLGAPLEAGLLMGTIMKAKTIIAAAVVLLASGVGYLLLSDPTATGTSSREGTQIESIAPVQSAELTPSEALIPAPTEQPDAAVAGRTTITPVSPNVATLTGRTVDATNGSPVAGVTVVVDPSDQLRVSAQTAGLEIAAPAPQRTALDGRFSISFETAPGWSFALKLSGAGIVPLRSRSHPLPPTIADLGTIEVTRGSVVRGRLVDEAGQPLPHQIVSIDDRPFSFQQRLMLEVNSAELLAVRGPMPPSEQMAPRQLDSFYATTDPDGQFEIPEPVPPGVWVVQLNERRRLVPEPATEIDIAGPTVWIDLIAESTQKMLSGVVVDDVGNPVAEAEVNFELVNGTAWHVSRPTGPDGAFQTPGFSRDPDDPVVVWATRSGYVPSERIAREWDSSFEIVLPRGGTVDLLVTEADGSTPVEDYGVRLFKIPQGRNVMTGEARLRHIGTHDAGRLQIPNALPGQNLLMVEPASTDLQPSWFEPVDVGSGTVSPIEVRLHTPVTRDVVVVDPHGMPVSGSSVELLKIHEGRAVKASTDVVRRPRLSTLWLETSAVVLAEGSTDSDGRLELRSAPARDLALRIRGSGHQPVVINDLQLEAGMPELVVEVKAGAVVTGHLQPPLRLPESEPTLHLLNVTDPEYRFPEGRRGHVAIAGDGSFAFSNVPEGSWHLVMDTKFRWGSVLTIIEGLRAGEERQVAVDVSAYDPAVLRGRVFVDRESVAATVVVETLEPIQWGSSRDYTIYGPVVSDAGGRFDLQAPAGRYRLLVEVGSTPDRWKSQEIIELFPGQESHGEYHFARKRFTARLLDSEGHPLTDRDVEVLWKENTWPAYDLRSDGTGHITIDPAPPDGFRLGIRPPGLASSLAWQEHWRVHAEKAYESLILTGPFEARSDSTVVVRFPPSRR